MHAEERSFKTVKTLSDLAQYVNYSFTDTLVCDAHSREDGQDHYPREVFSGHYVRVKPTPMQDPQYIAHSQTFFDELGFSDSLAQSPEFMQLFSGDTRELPEAIRSTGWATGYALSIYGTEYYDQCPFRSGNGYGDGRAISILELLIKDKPWEMQLKGSGRTPYCRGADGRAVLRSSIREFLAQEHMHALGVPTSRSLTLYKSNTDKVRRPWFLNGSYSKDPEVMIEEQIAISTRVASSFLRVGQLELFGRRARKHEHPKALEELEKLIMHTIKREYSDEIDDSLARNEKIVQLAYHFRSRLTSLVANWIRVGYCQGNFNSDNCSVGGFTLDYGPFGFIDMFDPKYQPWTGGGLHFSFLHQPLAAERNFQMLVKALAPLLEDDAQALQELDALVESFPKIMQETMMKMWASKLGLETFNAPIFNELVSLMMQSSVDYTIFFRELSSIPEDISALEKSFYTKPTENEELFRAWSLWLEKWRSLIHNTNPDDINAQTPQSHEKLSQSMKLINPKYTLREWFLVPAYKASENGDDTLLKELQAVMNDPYSEQSSAVEAKYYQPKPSKFFDIAGISHVSCSS